MTDFFLPILSAIKPVGISVKKITAVIIPHKELI